MDLPPSGPGSKRRRTIFFVVCGLVVLLVVYLGRGVLLPFLLAIVVAYVLAPLVRALERYGPRWAAVLSLYAVLVGMLSLLSVVAVPRIAAEFEKLAQEAPRAVARARTEWIPWVTGRLELAMEGYGHQVDDHKEASPEDQAAGVDLGHDGLRIVPDGAGGYLVALPPEGLRVIERGDGVYRITTTHKKAPNPTLIEDIEEAISGVLDNTQSHAVALFRTAQQFVAAVVKGVFTFVITLMLSAYLLATSDRIFAFFRKLVRQDRQESFDRLLAMIDRGLSGVVRGQLLIALLNGFLSGVAFFILDLRYWPILTVIATVLSIIPIFGAIISSVPAVFVALEQGLVTALITLGVIVGVHQLEANLFNPKIMGDAARVHPVLVVFALLAGEHMFGIAGALLAVPVLSIVQSLFFYYREQALGLTVPPLSEPPPKMST